MLLLLPLLPLLLRSGVCGCYCCNLRSASLACLPASPAVLPTSHTPPSAPPLPCLLASLQVAGNFHIAPGRSYQQGAMHIHDLSPFVGQTFDFSHTIHRLAFGQEYPGMKNPLDGATVKQAVGAPDGSGGWRKQGRAVSGGDGQRRLQGGRHRHRSGR